MKREAAEEELTKSGLVYRNPEGGEFETADEYLSGDVREKLKTAVEAADSDSAYEHNVEALKKVTAALEIAVRANVCADLYDSPAEHEAAIQNHSVIKPAKAAIAKAEGRS